jgi:hypothetical protein
MKRLLIRVGVIAVAAAPLAARADAHEPTECTTTTTVHCTGAAAPYAVQAPAAAQPVAVPAPIPPPPIYLPAPQPPPAYAPAPYASGPILDLHQLEDGGWKLVQRPDGSLWRERQRSSASAAVWGTGLALFSVSWLAGGVTSVTNGQIGPAGFIPVLGAWINAGVTSNSSCDDNFGSSCDHRQATALWALDGIAQVAGFTMLLVGMASGPKKLERQPILLAPGAVGYGAPGVTAMGHF